ncbi:YceD family protein [Candidatus Mycalebacterium sp.]
MLFEKGEIGNDRLSFEVSRNAVWLTNISELAKNTGKSGLLSPVLFKAGIEKMGGEIFISGTLSFELLSPCSRCLKPAKSGVSHEINSFVQLPANQSKIDISDDMREQVAMAIPEKTVCAKNCKGLCASCGADLNENPCKCERREIDPRLKALKEIRLS